MGFNNMKSLSDHNLDRLQLENFDEDDTIQINIPNTVTPFKD